MKNYKQYNKFVVMNNAHAIVYGNKVIRHPFRKSGLMIFFRRLLLIRAK